MKDECGIFANYQFKKSITTCNNVINGLKKIQHRGQESCGIAFVQSDKINVYKNRGYVKDVFKKYDELCCNICIGHVRYSTSGNHLFGEIQPFIGSNKLGEFALVHNGNIPNLEKSSLIKNKKLKIDYLTDSDFLKKYIEISDLNSWEEILIDIMNRIPGVYSLIIMVKNCIYALRDRYGVRPLCIGWDNNGWYVSSESCSFDKQILIKDVKPGEIIKIDNNINTIYQHKEKKRLHCIFEYFYFSSKNSILDGYNITEVRKNFGKFLAIQEKVKFDVENTVVVGSPNSGILAGIGYAIESGLPYKQVLVKNPNYNRSFIMPNQKSRIEVCNKKFKIDTDIVDLKNTTILLIDDSVVRGNTMKSVIKLFLDKNVKEIHIRVAAPPLKYPCYFGIDMPTYEELIINNIKNYEKLAKYFGANSIDYITMTNVMKVMKKKNFCTACFDGNYNKKLLDW